MKFVFFSVSENGENGLGDEGADVGNAPSRIFGLEPPLHKKLTHVSRVCTLQADTSLRSVSSCPCLLSPLRGSHTVSALARLCRMPRPAVRVDDRSRPCVHSCKPRQRYRRSELFCNIRCSRFFCRGGGNFNYFMSKTFSNKTSTERC